MTLLLWLIHKILTPQKLHALHTVHTLNSYCSSLCPHTYLPTKHSRLNEDNNRVLTSGIYPWVYKRGQEEGWHHKKVHRDQVRTSQDGDYEVDSVRLISDVILKYISNTERERERGGNERFLIQSQTNGKAKKSAPPIISNMVAII